MAEVPLPPTPSGPPDNALGHAAMVASLGLLRLWQWWFQEHYDCFDETYGTSLPPRPGGAPWTATTLLP
ncbi:hypothetical protein [Streptomyces sp. 4N124]|uniref:hypothetical protein n=1 Tax=Streptomyces sp. 4N124 TaxID=3457420 RepID=UPI003FCFC1F3